MANILCIGLKSPITLAKLTLWPLNSYHTCVVLWCRCVENLKNIGQKLLKLFSKDVKMLTEWRNHGMTESRNDGITELRTDWKQYTPLKLRFAGGIKSCKFVKNYFFIIIVLHAHLQYVWNMSAKYWKEILKALGGVDFTNYALPTIIVYKQWSKNGFVKKCCKFVKNYFLSL